MKEKEAKKLAEKKKLEAAKKKKEAELNEKKKEEAQKAVVFILQMLNLVKNHNTLNCIVSALQVVLDLSPPSLQLFKVMMDA